ncbi:MAG: hypothetical protein ACRYFW_14375 [Janthinobacterium lividum]
MSAFENPLAFPGPGARIGTDADHGFPIFGDATQGMTLRDWFAGRAMHGIVGSIGSDEGYLRLDYHARADNLTVSQWIARDAYKQADAMLAERGKAGAA